MEGEKKQRICRENKKRGVDRREKGGKRRKIRRVGNRLEEE